MAKAPPRQLPLELALEPAFGREDFLVGPSNEQAMEMIDLWPDWPERLLVLAGPEGSGKTHLAHIWAAMSGALILPASRLGDRPPGELARHGAIVLEDADMGVDEARLFHLINRVREDGASLLLTGRAAPDHWRIGTPDLISRLRLAPLVAIAAPDDSLIRALMVKHFLDRQLMVDTSVVEFLLPRIERSFGGVARIVATLDREALARGRRITRAIAAEVLAGQTVN